MLLSAVLLATALQLSPLIQAPAPTVLCAVAEPSSPGARMGVPPARGDGDVNQVLASNPSSGVGTGALEMIRPVVQEPGSAMGLPAQASQTTAPQPSDPPASASTTGVGLAWWQAAVIAVVVAGAVVWLTGRLRRRGRRA